MLVLIVSQERLEGTKHTYIQWLEFVGRMRWQGNYHDTMLERILHDMNVHVTFGIVYDEADLVLLGTMRPLMDMLKCLHEALTIHPTTGLQNEFGTVDRISLEFRVPLLSGN